MFGGCDQPNILCCNVLMLICLFPYYLTKKTLCLRQGQKRFLWNSLPCPVNLHQEEKHSALKRRQRAPLPRLSLQHTSPHLSFLNHYNVTYAYCMCFVQPPVSEWEAQEQHLLEMFPKCSLSEARSALSIAKGDMEEAVRLIIEGDVQLSPSPLNVSLWHTQKHCHSLSCLPLPILSLI